MCLGWWLWAWGATPGPIDPGHRTTDWFRLKGPWSNPSAQAGPPTAGCPGPHPDQGLHSSPAFPRGVVAAVLLPATSSEAQPGGFMPSLELGYKMCFCTTASGEEGLRQAMHSCAQLQYAPCPSTSPKALPSFGML